LVWAAAAFQAAAWRRSAAATSAVTDGTALVATWNSRMENVVSPSSGDLAWNSLISWIDRNYAEASSG